MPAPKGHAKYPGAGRPKGAPNRKTLVRRRAEARALRQVDITAERTMLQIGRVAFVNRMGIWQDGHLLPVSEWPADVQAVVEDQDVIIKNAAAGDGHTDTVLRVRTAKLMPALDTLAKHFGLVTERSELKLSGSVDLVDLLRQRHGKHRPE